MMTVKHVIYYKQNVDEKYINFQICKLKSMCYILKVKLYGYLTTKPIFLFRNILTHNKLRDNISVLFIKVLH